MNCSAEDLLGDTPVVNLLVARRTPTQCFALRIVNPLSIRARHRLRDNSPIDQRLVIFRVWSDIHGGVVWAIAVLVYALKQ
jgi:hypothetical protein